MNTNTIVLTGATGFLGSHILKGLVHTNTYHVVVLKRSFSNPTRIANLLQRHDIEYLNVDLEENTIKQRFSKGDISAVIHCATEYGRGRKPIASVLRANLIFPINLLDMCVEFGVDVFINTDSYFNKPSLQYPYLLDYSLSKKSLLLWLPYFANKLRIANMTLEHIFGPTDGEAKFVTTMIKQIAIAKSKAVSLSPGNQIRDFIYVHDVVSAYLTVLATLLAERKTCLKEFEVGTGQGTSIRSFVEAIKELSGSPTQLKFGAIPYRDAEIMDSKANTDSLMKLGWHPNYNYYSGLTDLLKRMRAFNMNHIQGN